MEKMSLIVGSTTGHVLGACTRTADPEGALTPEQLVGAGLLVRAAAPAIDEPAVIVQPQHLKIESVDRRDDVILSHRNYVLEDGLPTERGAIAPAPPPVTYNPGTRTLTVTLPAAAPEDIEVWVQLEDEDEPSQPIIVIVAIDETETAGEAPVTLATGQYPFLLLAPGYRAFVDVLNVP